MLAYHVIKNQSVGHGFKVAAAVIPFVCYLAYVILTVDYDVDRQNCCRVG